MPKVKSYAPGWLKEPAPGHKLFLQSLDDIKVPVSQFFSSRSKPGPRRTIARRGTEVFVAVGKQIRWGDLAHLKDAWAASESGARLKRESSRSSFEIYEDISAPGEHDNVHSNGYRTIKTPVADEIRQLVMSPNEDYLAILTTHTVHICILPDASHLTSSDASSYRPKFWTLGPTTHVTSRAPIASAVWHPLGVSGSTIVTVTEDAIVRVWELSISDRWSFDSPTLAVDLKKLASGTSLDQDFSASASTTNVGFSPDSFDMEVASACFGGRRSGGWSPMTLWIAMRGGDVYALCPLLPQKWSPPPTLIPSLSVSVVAKVAADEDDSSVSPAAKLLAQQQLDWMADLDNQDPQFVEAPYGEIVEVYTRPARPGAVPKLQGPFPIELGPEDEDDDDVELTDIHVIGEKASTQELMSGEDDEFEMGPTDEDGLSLTIVCFLSTSGRIKVCLDLDGVEAQWLPPRKSSRSKATIAADAEPPTLLTFQTLDTLKPAENADDNWPMFSEDVNSRYAFFVTQSCGITYVSLAPWVFRLEGELQGKSEAGSKFRLGLLVEENGSIRERVYTRRRDLGPLSASVAFRDPDLGYFVLSATYRDPVAVIFETPEDDLPAAIHRETTPDIPGQEEDRQPLTIWEPRPFFHPPDIFGKATSLTRYMDHLRTSKRRPLVHQEVRLSLATLEIFTDCHRVVSADIDPLNSAVAELFRKCEALQAELQEQVSKTNEVRRRVEGISEREGDGDDTVSTNELILSRIRKAKERQDHLSKRMDGLKRKLGQVNCRDLSDKEIAWMQEVQAMEEAVLQKSGATTGVLATHKGSLPWRRLEEVKSLKESLFAQVEQMRKKADEGQRDGTPEPAAPYRIPADIKRAKYAQVKQLLDRESALVEAVKCRLERLSVG
ncbi:hypothetical protein VTK73DRAFT_9765 [Phialemonium thermophilum]|uniref:Nuclear pore complex protein An-Nup82 n=1 Tax=Phialemonium thermophilum TaxID=223376 RepID=A0ABR3XJP9_9PEZI